MNQNDYNRVFISYAKEDFSQAEKIYTFLKENGLIPWLDKFDLLPGEIWELSIPVALEKADFVILLLSKTSVQKRGYVQREFKKALEFLDDKLDTDIYLIPVKLDDCEVPPRLQKIHWVNYEEDTLNRILESIQQQQSILNKSTIQLIQNATVPHQDTHVLFKFLALKNHRIANDIFRNKLSEIPIDKPLLHSNGISDFCKKLLTTNIKSYATVIQVRTFRDEQEILNCYQDIRPTDTSSMEYPYFSYERIPGKEEIIPFINELDGITQYLLHTDIPVESYVISFIREVSVCGDSGPDPYEETFVFKDTWFTFLAIENVSDQPLVLSELKSDVLESIDTLRPFHEKTGETDGVLNFPKTSLKPNTTVLIPTGMLACPFEGYYHEEQDYIARKHFTGEYLPYTMLVQNLNPSGNADYMQLGYYLRPEKLLYTILGREYEAKVHEWNPNNLYTIDEYWDCGSCPHLFVFKADGKWHYSKELLTKETNTDEHEFLTIEQGVTRIRIAELENETTYIRYLKVNNVTALENIEMINGDTIELNVSEGDHIHIYGHYEKAFENIPKNEQNVFRNRLISHYLSCNQIAKQV